MNRSFTPVRMLAGFLALCLGASALQAQSEHSGTYIGNLYNTNSAGENIWFGVGGVEFTIENDGRFIVTNQLFGTVDAGGVVKFDTKPGLGVTNGTVVNGVMTGQNAATVHDPYTIRFEAQRVAGLLPMWTEFTNSNLPPGAVSSSVAFGNGMFIVMAAPVATTQGWTFLISTNGTDWVPHKYNLDVGGANQARVYPSRLFFAKDRFWFSVCGDNAGGPNTRIYSTVDGDSLTAADFGQKFGNLADLTHDGSKFVGVLGRNGGSQLRVLTSPDASAWSLSSVNGLDREPTGIAFANGHYLVSTDGLTNFTSPDLINWTTVAYKPDNSGFGISSLAAGNGRFFASGTDLYTSTDAETWTKPSPGAGGAFVTIRHSDGFFYGITRSYPSLYRSVDGNSWRKLVRPSTNTAVYYYPENLAVGLGYAFVTAQGKFLISAIPAGDGLQVGQPPIILTHPSSTTLPGCGTGFLQASVASGGLSMSQYWIKDGVPLGQTEGTITLTATNASVGGDYALVAVNGLGSVTSRVATVTISGTGTGPAITVQPVSQTVLAGVSVTLRVTASGSSPRYYTWMKDGVPVGYATTLNFSSVNATNAGNYTVRVQNGCGFVDSQVATITVLTPADAPKITEHPESRTVTAGGTATFSVTATGASPLAYQWQRNTVNIDAATNTSFTINIVGEADAGQYRCVVSNPAGSTNSNPATLTIQASSLAPDSIAGHKVEVRPGQALASDLLDFGTTTFSYYFSNGYLVQGSYTYTKLSSTTARLVATATFPANEAGAVDDILLNFNQPGQGTYEDTLTQPGGSTNTIAGTFIVDPAGPGTAPVIFQQPDSLTAQVGSSATFFVAAGGSPILRFEWRKDGVPQAGKTTGILEVNPVTLADAGNYVCVITNSAGSITSSVVTLTVSGGTIFGAVDPSWTLSPTNIVGAIAPLPGGKVVAVVSGSKLMRLNSDGTVDSSFTIGVGPRLITAPITFPVVIPGSTNAGAIYALAAQSDGKLLVGGTFNDWNGLARSALVRLNTDGSIDESFATGSGFTGGQSDVQQIEVLPDGKILVAGQYTTYNGAARQLAIVRLLSTGTLDSSFEDTAGGFGPGVSRFSRTADGRIVVTGIFVAGSTPRAQVFRVNANGGLDSTFAAMSTGTTVSPIAPVSAALPDGRVLVSGGNSTYNGTTVNPMLFRLKTDGTVDTTYPGVALTNLNLAGTVARFTVLGDGRCYINGPFTSVNGQPRNGLARLLADGSLDASFVPPSAFGFPATGSPVVQGDALLAAGTWAQGPLTVYGVVRLTTGDASTTATAPTITAQPQPVTTPAGSTVTFSVTATGTSPLSYQWRKNDANIPGANAESLTLTNVSTSDVGGYRCVVSNSAGTATSSVATLEISATVIPPTITQDPQSQAIIAGSSIQLFVHATGTAPLSYQWVKNGTQIPGATLHILGLPEAQIADSGEYRAIVSNSAGSVTSAVAVVTVSAAPVAPTITEAPVSLTVNAGQSATFNVTAIGTAPLAYQWQKNGANITGATSSTLQLNGVTAAQAGDYRVVVTNSVGSVTSTPAMLVVITPPAISTQPFSLTVIAGAPASFQVAVTGSAPFAYQWRKSGTNITGATSASYTIGATSTNDAGVFSVVVTNSAGSVTSADAILTVTPPAVRGLTASVAPTNAPGQLNTRVAFIAQGNETSVSFSLHFNTNALSQPVVTLLVAATPAGATPPAKSGTSPQNGKADLKELPAGSTLTTDLSRVANGEIGITVAVPEGQTIPIGEQPLVDVTWTLAEGQQPSNAGLMLANTPVAQGATDSAGTQVPVTSVVLPSEQALPFGPTPSGQTGLFGQVVKVSNPGGTALPGVRVLIKNLGNDSRGNAITVFNAVGATTNNIPYIEYGPLGPGATVPLNLEFYISDRTTVPAPQFEIIPLTALPEVSTEGLTVVSSILRKEKGAFAVEFPSAAGRYYVIQYASELTNWVSSLPAIRGTGSRVQWLDNGPPRTTSHPTNANSRIYRVLLSN